MGIFLINNNISVLLYRNLLLAPGELPGRWEVGRVPGDLLEHPVRVVHLLFLDLLVEEALVVEAVPLLDVIHSGCHLRRETQISKSKFLKV